MTPRAYCRVRQRTEPSRAFLPFADATDGSLHARRIKRLHLSRQLPRRHDLTPLGEAVPSNAWRSLGMTDRMTPQSHTPGCHATLRPWAALLDPGCRPTCPNRARPTQDKTQWPENPGNRVRMKLVLEFRTPRRVLSLMQTGQGGDASLGGISCCSPLGQSEHA